LWRQGKEHVLDGRTSVSQSSFVTLDHARERRGENGETPAFSFTQFPKEVFKMKFAVAFLALVAGASAFAPMPAAGRAAVSVFSEEPKK
jgi:hypothetical protein